MKKKSLFSIKGVLHFLALVCLFSMFFAPLWLMVKGYDVSEISVLKLLALCEAAGFFGFLLKNLLSSLKFIKAGAEKILSIIFVIPVLAGGVMLSLSVFEEKWAAAVLTAIFSGDVYFSGVLFYNKTYDAVFTKSSVIAMAVLGAISIFAAVFTKADLNPDYIILVFMVSVCVYALSQNQRSIDTIMDRRGHSMSQLPPKMRSYSLKLTLCLCAAVIILVVFRNFFGEALVFIFEEIKNGALAVFKFILSLFEGDSASGGTVAEKLPAESGMPDIGESGNRLVSTIFFIILISLIVIFSVKPLFNKIKAFIRNAFILIKKWLSEGRKSERRAFGSEGADYTDTVETISADGAPVVLKNPAQLRRFKRDLAAFSKMSDSPEKMIFGYKLAVRGLTLHGIKIEDSETQLEILEKAKRNLKGSAFEAATYCYNEIVFGKKPPELKIPQMEETLSAIKAMPVVKM